MAAGPDVPPSRRPGAELFQNDVARHFKQEITPEEGAGRHAVSGGFEAEILVHGERGEADVDAIEIAKEINQNGQRQEPRVFKKARTILINSLRRPSLVQYKTSSACALYLFLLRFSPFADQQIKSARQVIVTIA